MSKRRQLIVLMGLDGSGKSTQAALLAQSFKERGEKAAVVWMRGESYLTLPLLKVAKAVMRAPKAGKRGAAEDTGAQRQYTARKRSLFRNPLARELWRRLVLADFYLTYRHAFGRLPRGTSVVILDRYIYDSLIDIDTAFGSRGAEVKRLLASGAGMVPRPDKVVLIDIPPAEAMRRKNDIPSMAYLEERTGLYRIVAQQLGATTVDGTKPIEAVRRAIAEAVRGLLAERKPRDRFGAARERPRTQEAPRSQEGPRTRDRFRSRERPRTQEKTRGQEHRRGQERPRPQEPIRTQEQPVQGQAPKPPEERRRRRRRGGRRRGRRRGPRGGGQPGAGGLPGGGQSGGGQPGGGQPRRDARPGGGQPGGGAPR